MRKLTQKIIFVALLTVLVVSFQNCMGQFSSMKFEGASVADGDAFFAANGVDTAGNTIGTDCTLKAPCKTISKALALLAANVASNSQRDYVFYFEDVGGPFYISTPLVYNSTHTVDAGHKTSFRAYPGQTPVISGGRDIAGTWSTVNPIPNGGSTAGCVSNALVASAPLVDGTSTTNAGLFVGVMWVNGRRVQEVIQPRIGNAPDYVAGTPGTAVGASVATGPTATFTNGSPNITISDLAKIGIVGQTIAFDTSAAGFSAFRRYWILSKATATGAGVITLSGNGPGRAVMNATASVSGVQVSDPVQSNNMGQRTESIDGMNQFPVNAGYNSAYNPTDVKIWMPSSPGSGGALIPIASASATQVTLNSRWFVYDQMYSGVAIRRWNAFEDLGTGGNVGELWTNRQTGRIYYTPRAGETCASINTPGSVIIPTNPEILLKVSSATADGSVDGQPAGNLIVKGFRFAHTNTSVFTGVNNLNGSVGGFVNGGDSFSMSVLDSAVTLIGATYVTLDGNEIGQLGGSALAVSWGSNHIVVQNNYIHDVGGYGLLSGMAVNGIDNFHYQTDFGYYGTNSFGPSTPSWNSGGSAHNPDQTGNSDCCNTFYNNKIIDVGIVNNGAACMPIAMWQNFVVDHNTMLYCPNGGLQETSISGTTVGAPSYSGRGSSSPILVPVSYNNKFTNNEIGYVGYETSLTGAHIPGSTMGGDFGAFYIQSGQDGLADGTNPTGFPLIVSGNWVHDISASCWQTVSDSGTIRAKGLDGVLDYHDGNSSNGIIEESNLFTLAATVEGRTPCPTTFTQHTGNLRTLINNNIFAGTFPAGSVIGSSYRPHGDVTEFYAMPWRNSAYTCTGALPCYVINNGILYSATASGTSGASVATIPSCSSGTCAADGSMSWTFVEHIPVNPAIGAFTGLQETHNITAWAVTGGGSTDYPQAGYFFPLFSEFVSLDYNLYFQSGHTLANYSNSNGLYSWATWNSLSQDVNSNSLGGWNADPNFADLTGASGLASWLFDTAGGGGYACQGAGRGTYSPACHLGFVPFDLSGVGAH